MMIPLGIWLSVASVSVISGMPLTGENAVHSRVRREAMEDLMRRTFDFSSTCPGGIILKVNDTRINTRDLRLGAAEAVSYLP